MLNELAGPSSCLVSSEFCPHRSNKKKFNQIVDRVLSSVVAILKTVLFRHEDRGCANPAPTDVGGIGA